MSACLPQSPLPIRGQKYISLGTFRKSGVKIATPVWFGEDGDKLYVMTLSDMGKTKRIRNNPQVTVAPCTIRGKVTGPEVGGVSAHSAARGTCSRAADHQPEIFAGQVVIPVQQGGCFPGIRAFHSIGREDETCRHSVMGS